MKKICWVLVSCSLLFFGCSKKTLDHASNADASLIFGGYAGECGGDCSDIYFLDASSLAVYSANNYPNAEFFVGNFSPLPKEDFNNTKDLLRLFPSAIKSETNSILGCPDCADQGGYYLEYQNGDFHRAWFIDTNLDEVPTYLHDYLALLTEKIQQLPRE